MEQKKDLERIFRELSSFGKEYKEIRSLQKLAAEHRLRGDFNDAKWHWIIKNREQQNLGLKQEPYPEHLKSFDNFQRRHEGRLRLDRLDRLEPFEKRLMASRKQFFETKKERHWQT